MKPSTFIGSLSLAGLGLAHPLADEKGMPHLQGRDLSTLSSSDSISSTPATSSNATPNFSGVSSSVTTPSATTGIARTTAATPTDSITTVPSSVVSTTSLAATQLTTTTTITHSMLSNSAVSTDSSNSGTPGPTSSAASLVTSQAKTTTTAILVTSTVLKSTISTAASAVPTALLCPVVNGTTVTNQGSDWVIRCNSDSTPGAFRSHGVLHSYLECMGACDTQAGCTAFVYQGGTNGIGSGQCWLQTYHGTYKAAPSGWIAAYKAVNGTAVSIAPVSTTPTVFTSVKPTITTTVSTTAASSTPSAQGSLLCPEANSQNYTTNAGAVFTIECGLDHFSGNMMRFSTNNFQQCVESCANTKGCVDVTLNLGWCYLKNVVGAVSKSPSVWGARLISNGTVAH
ncbi:hypothetical protein K461DRAFT_306893 [Myriangium duriaei CBS 260.36]|uniref:Apple domain-containing protein n=1 Tax=Myriangium duriaei CBS 260.36 TaxID=1168546 RepID=A0A9P4MIZ0_9PEZI|nr:hypothetical protein K461DRAFT_306893 [Myriangium duriaei CBS 260.36]